MALLKVAVLFTDGRQEIFITLDEQSDLLTTRMAENGWVPVLRNGHIVSRSVSIEAGKPALREAIHPKFGGGAWFTNRVA